MLKAPKMLKDDQLYIGDNGACFCGKHAGHCASTTGRDLSGQKVMPVKPSDQKYALEEFGFLIACETCEERAAA